MRLLVSVRSVEEALLVAAAGVDLIDLKEPRSGALGALPPATLRAIVAALREGGFVQPVSATVGDLPMDDVAPLLAQVAAVAACGVNWVKVGIDPRPPGAAAVLDALAACPQPVVPVLLADGGLPEPFVEAACARFPLLMADTFDKRGGSLFDRLDEAALRRFVAQAHAAGRQVGLAGSLRLDQFDRLERLGPDFAGFRGAVCVGARGDAMDGARLGALVARGRRAAFEAPAVVLATSG
jgi:uncharacterized protein (UPF0264 family)